MDYLKAVKAIDEQAEKTAQASVDFTRKTVEQYCKSEEEIRAVVAMIESIDNLQVQISFEAVKTRRFTTTRGLELLGVALKCATHSLDATLTVLHDPEFRRSIGHDDV